MHRGGFCAARVVKPSDKGSESGEPSPKVMIELLHNGEQMWVDEDDMEKMNARQLDLVEDISQLNHLNEASILHCLRQRYGNNLVHTNAGPVLVVVNPMAPLSLYSEKVRVLWLLSCLIDLNSNKYLFCRSYRCFEDASQRTCHHISILRPRMPIAL